MWKPNLWNKVRALICKAYDSPSLQEALALTETAKALNLEEAIAAAREYLSDEDLFYEAEPARPMTEEQGRLLDQFPGMTRDFMRHYHDLRFAYGFMIIGSNHLRPSTFADDLVRLGTDVDEAEILSGPDKLTIYITDQGGYNSRNWDEWPSLYHFLCYLGMLKRTDTSS